MIKVKAHANNQYNNYVDQLCAKTHYNGSDIIFKNNRLNTIRAVPLWNNIRIEQKLRRFITTMSQFSGFEAFLNLNRNGKYRRSEINWEATFYCLNSDENN